MKQLLMAFVLLVLFAPVFGSPPAKYVDYQVNVEVREDGTLNETINLIFPERVDSFDYYLLHPAYVRFFDSNNNELTGCVSSLEGTGTIVSCHNLSLSRLSMQFEYDKLVRRNGSFFILSDQYIFLTPTDNFILRIILPKGYVVSQKDAANQTIQAYYPMDAYQGSNGQQIYLEWKRVQQKAGGVFTYSAIYEKAIGTEVNDGIYIYIGAAASVIIGLLLLIYFRKKPTLKEYGLNDDERKVLDVLLKENKVSQKKIVRDTGFSKAHVSRLSKNLEERGIIERKRRGRTYEVTLKD